MRLFVSGSRGQVASATLGPLVEAGHELVEFDQALSPEMDYTSEKSLLNFFAKHYNAHAPFDAVIHFAGRGAPDRGHSWDDFFNVHVFSTHLLTKLATMYHIPRFIYVSSFTVYGLETCHQSRRPEYGDVYSPQAPENTNWYMAAKIMGEQVVKQYASSNPEAATVILRLASFENDFNGCRSTRFSVSKALLESLTAPKGLLVRDVVD